MATSNNIRHGEALADVRQGDLPGAGLQSFATPQFQAFLDELESLFDETDVTKLNQKLTILESLIATNVGALRNQHEQDFSKIMQLFYSLVSENARLKSLVSQFKQFKTVIIGASDTAHTTSGNEIIICNNTGSLDITLNTSPIDQEKIIVIRKGGAVSLIGDVNGFTPTSIPSVDDVLDVVFILALAGWAA